MTNFRRVAHVSLIFLLIFLIFLLDQARLNFSPTDPDHYRLFRIRTFRSQYLSLQKAVQIIKYKLANGNIYKNTR